MSARAFFGRGVTPLSATANNIFVTVFNSPPGGQDNTVSGTSTAVVSGGVPPYTYLWTTQSQTGFTIDLSNVNSQTVTATRIGPPGESTATVRLRVDDAVGTRSEFDITVNLTLESGL